MAGKKRLLGNSNNWAQAEQQWLARHDARMLEEEARKPAGPRALYDPGWKPANAKQKALHRAFLKQNPGLVRWMRAAESAAQESSAVWCKDKDGREEARQLVHEAPKMRMKYAKYPKLLERMEILSDAVRQHLQHCSTTPRQFFVAKMRPSVITRSGARLTADQKRRMLEETEAFWHSSGGREGRDYTPAGTYRLHRWER